MSSGKSDYRHHETKKPKKGKEKIATPAAIVPRPSEPQVIPKGKASKKTEEG